MLRKKKNEGRKERMQSACISALHSFSIASVANKFVSAYFRELGKKGGKASGASKRRSPEHYALLAEIRKKKKAAKVNNP